MKFLFALLFSLALATPVTPNDGESNQKLGGRRSKKDKMEDIESLGGETTTAPTIGDEDSPLHVEYAADDFVPPFPVPTDATDARFYCNTAQGEVPGTRVPGATEAMQAQIDALSISPSDSPSETPAGNSSVSTANRATAEEWNECIFQYAQIASALTIIVLLPTLFAKKQ